MDPQFLVNAVVSGSIYALVAIGFALVWRTARFFHFAHGGVVVSAMYFSWTLLYLSVPPLVSYLLGAVGATIVGIVIELSVYRPMRNAAATPLMFMLASLGLYIIIENALGMAWGTQTMKLRSFGTQGLRFLGISITVNQIVIISVAVLLVVLLAILLSATKVGKKIRAVANDPELASIMGIDSKRVLLFVIAGGSFLGGAAGILVSFDTFFNPTMGFGLLVVALTSLIVGGMNRLEGAILGGLLLGGVQQLSVWMFSSRWQDAITFGVLVLFLLLKPEGILVKRTKRAV